MSKFTFPRRATSVAPVTSVAGSLSMLEVPTPPLYGLTSEEVRAKST